MHQRNRNNRTLKDPTANSRFMSTPKTTPTPAKPTPRRRRITLADVEQLCFLMEAHRMTHKEATALMGICYESWRNWQSKAKNSPTLSDIQSRVKASWIAGRLANIQDAESGKGGSRRDWRSSAWLLERTVGDRFSATPPPPEAPRPPVSNLTINCWLEQAHKQIAAEAAGEVVDAVEVKALPPAPPAPEAIPVEDTWSDIVARANPQERREAELRIAGVKMPPVEPPKDA